MDSPFRRTVVLLIGLGCWGFSRAADAASPSERMSPEVAVRGAVYDAGGRPVAGAIVALVSNEATVETPPNFVRSAADGTFSFLRPPIGHYALTASASGATGVFRSNVDEIAARKIDVVLNQEEGVTLSGVAADLAGKPVTTALLTFGRQSHDDGDNWYVPVDNQGRFRVTLPKAHYTVLAHAAGYRADKQFTTATDGEAPSITIEMQPEDPAGESVLADLRAVDVALESCDPATPTLTDMEPLASFVGDAHIVALGEGSHGGHEMFQLKHRLFEFLVERLGFTVLGIEASWANTLPVEEYLATGHGDPELLAPAMGFWTWDTREVTDLLRWMRAYNVDPRHERKLHFVGFDMQLAPKSVAALLEYVGTHDRAYANRLANSLAGLNNDLDSGRLSSWPAAERAAATSEVAMLESYLERRRQRLIISGGKAQWERARHHAEVLSQFIALNSDEARYDENRDRFMMRNTEWILAHQPAGTKIALWAANAHVQKRPLVGADATMGQRLAEQHGEDYRALLTLFDSGSFRAWGAGSPPRGLMEHDMAPAPIGSVEGTLTRLGPEIVGVNLHSLRPGTAAERWSHYLLRMRVLGASYLRGQNMFVNRPIEVADGLFLIRHMTASHYLGPVWKPQIPLQLAMNSGFEELPAQSPPLHWELSGASLQAGYRSGVVQSGCHSGLRCAIVSRTLFGLRPDWGALDQPIDATPFRGRRVRLRAAVRVDTRDQQGGARLLLRTEARDLTSIDVSSTPGPLIRSKEWQEYEVTVDVAPRATVLRFGVAVTGDANAWLDDVEVTSLGSTPAMAK